MAFEEVLRGRVWKECFCGELFLFGRDRDIVWRETLIPLPERRRDITVDCQKNKRRMRTLMEGGNRELDPRAGETALVQGSQGCPTGLELLIQKRTTRVWKGGLCDGRQGDKLSKEEATDRPSRTTQEICARRAFTLFNICPTKAKPEDHITLTASSEIF